MPFKWLGNLNKGLSFLLDIKFNLNKPIWNYYLGIYDVRVSHLPMCDLIYISFPVKLKLFKSLAVSILLYGCESWTLTADLSRRIKAFEHTCYRRVLHISYKEHRTNEFVRQQVTNYAGRQEPLLATVKRRKLAWDGHIYRQESLAKIILQGTAEGK